jgi:hypothetical protein
MLQITPDANIEQDIEEDLGDELYCVACGHAVTRHVWRVSRGDGHEHIFFNPAGLVFSIVCFKEAPGVASGGAASDEFSWFKGYTWQVSACAGCSEHLGWQFSCADEVFFGLIKPKLTTKKPD